MIRAHRVAPSPRTVAFFPAMRQFRAVSVQDHGERMPVDCRFEVVYQEKDDVAWRFFATREQADEFARSVR